MTERVLDMSSPGSDVRARKTRASKPKVKTGCQTCKIRRVKCDETKPNCLRCLKFGHQCDGYIPRPTSKPSSGSSNSRLLVPKSSPSSSPSLCSTSTTFEGELPYKQPKLYPAPPPLSLSPTEHHAFNSFCHTTSSAPSWTRLMLSACETSPSIRHAVISLGALNLSSSRASTSKENGVGTLRHQWAFHQYNKALCFLRRDVAGEKCELRTTLISSLLFYCFEAIHGYHDLAISQVHTGLKLIKEWANSFHGPEDESDEDILRGLEVQVMLYADGRTREAHDVYRRGGQDIVDEMPAVFSGLPEARGALEVVIRRSMHWLRSTMHLHTFSAPSSPSPPSSPDEKAGAGAEGLFFDVDSTFSERLTTLAEYERWDGAFLPLLNHARSRSAPHSTFILASTLRLHWLAGYMSIASNNSRCALVNNGKYTVLLQELVGIAKLLVDGSNKEMGAWDMQIIVPVLTIGWVYRHRTLRRVAVELLARSPGKEGVWDGRVVGGMMGWLAGVEDEVEKEEDGDGWEKGEYVSEEAVARCIRMGFDEERREAHVSCLQPWRGEERRRSVVIPW